MNEEHQHKIQDSKKTLHQTDVESRRLNNHWKANENRLSENENKLSGN